MKMFPMMLYMLVLVLAASTQGTFGQVQGSAGVPTDVNGEYISKINSIVICWQHMQGATQYQVQTIFPDGSTKLYNTSIHALVLKDVERGSSYKFTVRHSRDEGFARIASDLTVTTQNITEVSGGMSVSVNVNDTSIFTWAETLKMNNNKNNNNINNNNNNNNTIPCLTYTMEICQRVEVLREWTTNESLVSDVRILEHFDEETNRTSTVYLKQHTIHYEQTHVQFLGYDNVSCETHTSNQLHFACDGLTKGMNYTYRVSVYHAGRWVGAYEEGMFVATGYVAPVVVVKELLTGLDIYLLACGILLTILMTAFVMSLVCGWDRVVNDVAVRKDKMRKAKAAEMDKKMKAKVLTEGFINDQTQAGPRYP